MKTLVVGHVTHDRYEGGIVAGGCAYYGARVHDQLQGQTKLVTVVGEDFECDDAIAGLDRRVERSGQTTVFANYYPAGQPRIQLLEARAPAVQPGSVDPAWLDAELVHLAPVCREIDLERWLEAVGDGLVAINVQGWLKKAGETVDPDQLESIQRRGVTRKVPRVVEEPWDVDGQLLKQVDIACLSEEDLRQQDDLLERLIESVPVVALTRGKQGSRIYVEGDPTDVGIVATESVDPTGAGDVFAAAFSHAVAGGRSPVAAAQRAAAASSLVIEDIGAAGLRRFDELEERTERVRRPSGIPVDHR